MPLGNPSHCFNHSTLASPKVSISSQLSAPQITAQMAISRISCSRWSHFPLIRGSGNSAKYATRLASLLISSPLVLSPPLYSPSILFHALALGAWANPNLAIETRLHIGSIPNELLVTMFGGNGKNGKEGKMNSKEEPSK